MPAIIQSAIIPAPALAAHVEAALASLDHQIAHACVACGATAVELVEFDTPSSWREEGESAAVWHCSRCGANESEVEDLVVIPAAAFAALVETRRVA